MRCTSCRHRLTEEDEADPEAWRNGHPYCPDCRGCSPASGRFAASDWSVDDYYHHGWEHPPGVATWAARSQ